MDASPAFLEILIRILAALIAGTLVGLERESRGRPAGLRTTILTCVAAAVAMILSEHLFHDSNSGGNGWRPDPARLGAGILTGIGFLGAGTILRQQNVIRGVTTAATLWFMTVSGLAFGAGLFALGSLSVGVALVTLYLLPSLEKHLRSDRYAKLTVTTELDAVNERQLEQQLREQGFKIKRTELNYDLLARQKTICCELQSDHRMISEQASHVIAALRSLPGVLKINWT